MGKGGQVKQAEAAEVDAFVSSSSTSSTKAPPATTQKEPRNTEYGLFSSYTWTSPFTSERMDPRIAKKSLKEINAQFPTKSELRAVIPPHCFERSTLRSLSYVFRDIVLGALCVYVTSHILSVDPPEGGFWGSPWKWLLWRLGWNVYAQAMTISCGGLWVIGHECGHGAFSPIPWVNGLVGWILHSALLVPYFSWAFSHAKHHRRTNDLMDGETHVPVTKETVGLRRSESGDHYERIPADEIEGQGIKDFYGHADLVPYYGHALMHERLGDEAFSFLMGWSRLFMGFPVYLAGFYSGGHLGNDGKPLGPNTLADHFRPWSRLFHSRMYWKVIASDLGVLLTASILAYFSWTYSFRAVWFWYFGPYMHIHAFLVYITWLQHSDPTVPHFDTENWNWMKGTLAGTIDRPLQGWLNFASHNIGTTHIVHHLFHEIPHYHAVEATAHLRAYLEPKGLYNYDPTCSAKAMWRVWKTCHFVDSNTEGVQYYRKLSDVPVTSKKGESKKSQ